MAPVAQIFSKKSDQFVIPEAPVCRAVAVAVAVALNVH